MATINSVTMIGRLVRDPELRDIKGIAVCTITIATEHEQRKKDGTTTKEVCFIDTTIWGATATSCSQWLKKGSTIAVEGRLKLEKWNDKASGLERTKHVIVAENVVFLDPKQSALNLAEAEQPAQKKVVSPLPNKAPYKAQDEETDFDDTLPF